MCNVREHFNVVLGPFHFLGILSENVIRGRRATFATENICSFIRITFAEINRTFLRRSFFVLVDRKCEFSHCYAPSHLFIGLRIFVCVLFVAF